MKTYIGTKTIKATPAYRSTDKTIYPKVGGLPPDVDINSCEDGYMVMYENGYTSWSPKDVFENTYRIADTFKDRLTIEIDELGIKLTKLSTFLESKNFNNLDERQRRLLHSQYQIMSSYSATLLARLDSLQD